MKKTVYSILIITLFIGLGLIITEQLTKDRNVFKVPSGYHKEIIDLSDHTRSDELLFSRELESPSTVEIFIQSDNDSDKIIKIISDSAILGRKSNEDVLPVKKYTDNQYVSSTYLFNKGEYSVYLTSECADGKLVIGYRETPKELTEYERLSKIDKGELNNPPEGYSLVYSADLSGVSYNDELVHTLSLNESKKIGISIYTSSMQGNLSVNLIGESFGYYGLVSPEQRICDQLDMVLSPGEYQFKVDCEDTDGQVYIFIKQ